MHVPLLAELKRRRVFRALIGYGIAAFAVLQIVEPVMHGLHWPEPVLSYVVVALAAGFPIVVALAWIFDVSGGRIERTAPASGSRIGGVRLALALVAIGALAAAPGVLWYFVVRGGSKSTPATAQTPSIAVLPFVNLTGDKENEYFSDGITEEIINALANVEGLRVVARTSAFSFKGKDVNVRKIGEELNVATVLEGSVRRDGNQLRVSAQLIGALDGYHLWSRIYDRELKNVFAVEDELARAIVDALKPKLIARPRLVAQSTANAKAHDLYLRGRFFWNRRNKEGLAKAAALFEQAIAADLAPGYFRAGRGNPSMVLAAVAASSRLANPITAENFRPTVSSMRKAMLIPASDSEREICAPSPLRSVPSTRMHAVSEGANPALRATASTAAPSTGNTSTVARSSSPVWRYPITTRRFAPAAASGSSTSASIPLRFARCRLQSCTFLTVMSSAMVHPCGAA